MGAKLTFTNYLRWIEAVCEYFGADITLVTGGDWALEVLINNEIVGGWEPSESRGWIEL